MADEDTAKERDDFKVPEIPVASSTQKKPENFPPLIYAEPEWTGSPPPGSYSFEVIKQGTIKSNIKVKKSYMVIGRLLNCDIAVEHPSCSRYHAVFQYCRGGTVYPEGLYIYDLGSTHGTFVNKEQIRSKMYYRLRTGHVVKFGGSTRLYVMSGPEKEEEEMPINDFVQPDSCDWGINEDAEEDDLTDNPFALSNTENEELFLNDPKKTLRDWFEREGFELEYQVEEKGFKNFVCKVQLPIDNPSGEDFVRVEASVSGKKKEAVVACALEACRVLDGFGLLRQGQKESRKRKRKNWEDDDFYDSDEDTFLDRTGTIEKKREFRKKLISQTEPTETYDSLVMKIENLSKEILEIEEKLAKSKKSISTKSDTNTDPLDSFMTSLSNIDNVDAITKSKLRQRLAELRKEKERLEKLRDIAYTPGLPKLRTSTPEVEAKITEVEAHKEGVEPKKQTEKSQHMVKQVANVSSSNMPSSSELDTTDAEKDIMKNRHVVSQSNPDSREEKSNSIIILSSPSKVDEQHSKPILVGSSSSGESRVDIEKEKITDRHIVSRSKKVDSKIEKSCEDDFSMWVPPENQSGDGTTSLNAKYGY